MSRAKLWLLLIGLALMAALIYLVVLRQAATSSAPAAPAHPSKATPPSPPAKPSPARPAIAPPANPDPSQSGHPDAVAFGTPAIPPEREAAVLLSFLEAYRREFGAFPTGNENAHFLNALAGTNPSGLIIFPHRHPRVSKDGELLDAWGRPFHFHAISAQHLEVRSAGPDGTLFTNDDLVAGQKPLP